MGVHRLCVIFVVLLAVCTIPVTNQQETDGDQPDANTEPEIEEFPDMTKRKGQVADLNCIVKGLPDNPKDVLKDVNIKKRLGNTNLKISSFGQIILDWPTTISPPVNGSNLKYLAREQNLGGGRHQYTVSVRALSPVKDTASFECAITLIADPFKPRIKVARLTVLDSDFQNVTTPHSVQLLCEDAGAPHVDEVAWFKDGTEVVKRWKKGDPDLQPVNGGRFKLHQDRLDIVKSQVSDSGRYQCRVFSNSTNLSNVTTDLVVQDRPSTPRQLSVRALKSRSAIFSWLPSLPNNNPLFYYKLQVKPDMQDGWDKATEFRTNGAINNMTVTSFEPYKDYDARVVAVNGLGLSGWSEVYKLKTPEDVPSIPTIIDANDHKSTMVNISWERPKHPNGVLTLYTVLVKEKDSNASMKSHTFQLNKDSDQKAGTTTKRITGLKPYTQYCFYVTASTSAGPSGWSSCQSVYTDTAGPSAPVLLNITSNETESIAVYWSPPTRYNKSVNRYQVQLKGQRNGLDVPIINRTIDMPNELEVNTVPPTSQILRNITGNTTYEISIRAATTSIFSNPANPKYNYGEFSNAITYQLTDGGPSDREGKDRKQAGLEYIGIGVGIATAIIVVGVAFLIYTRRRMKSSEDLWIDIPDETSSAKFEDNEIDSIPVEKWAEHVAQLHADCNLKFAQEFEEINVPQDLTCNYSLDPDNKPKNRYTNILAYDKTRVVLAPLPGKQKGSDYINANYVGGYDNSRAYIATQGPLPNTIEDFWRLVWDRNSVVIVMITNLYEKGRKKCDQYWPEEVGQEATYGFITVKHVQKSELAFFTVRVFSVKNKGSKKARQERLVYQYHYTDWPDHGVPDYTLPVLEFIKKSHSKNTENSRPIIVHCSAGVGRTGTYIVIQSMIEQILAKNTVSVYSFLKHIRTQRNYLVQTEDQYVFIHDALLEYIQSGGNTEMAEGDMSAYLDHITMDVEGNTELERQFNLATYHQPREQEYETSRKSYISHKNRSLMLVPADNKNKVRIPMQPGIEGSDYINASYLHGYYQNEECIITQHPLPHTVQDFWRMVWDQNSMTIVMLSHVQDEFGVYWNNKDEILDWEGGNFKVTSTDEQFPLDHAVRDFMLESKQDDYELKTRMLSTTNWPEGHPLSSVFDFIKYVREWHTEHQAGPMIVIDNFGGKKAATFCALMTLLNKLEEEGTVDVYSLVKMYHLRRPRIFDSKDDMYFIYRAIESICKKRAAGENNLSMNSIDKSPSVQLQTFATASPRSSNYTLNSSHSNPPLVKKESTI